VLMVCFADGVLLLSACCKTCVEGTSGPVHAKQMAKVCQQDMRGAASAPVTATNQHPTIRNVSFKHLSALKARKHKKTNDAFVVSCVACCG
jgi:hypothetical protein